MDQVQHMAPVDLLPLFDHADGIGNSIPHKAQLLDPVFHQTLLKMQRVQQKGRIAVTDRELPDIFERKSKILQQKDLLDMHQVCIRIETGAVLIDIGGFQKILPVIEADRTDGYICQSRELTG